MAKLHTPYRFTPEVIHAEAPTSSPGSYILGNNAGGGLFRPRYVGRSDRDIEGRLATHGYLYFFEYFVVRKAADPQEAYRQECTLWHGYRQQGYDLANKIHPAAPPGYPNRCPFCAFAKHMSALEVD